MIRGDAVDGRADLYAVGVMLFELLTGRLPFEYNTVEEILSAHVKERPPRFSKIGSPHIGPAVEAVVQIALSKYPNERHPHARELAMAFEQATGFRFGTKPPRRGRPSSPRPRRTRSPASSSRPNTRPRHR